MYVCFIKRLLDFTLSLIVLVLLFPLLVILTLLGMIIMKGNPFFSQERPGKDEKIFKLFKFRTMTCQTDANGKPLPDAQRLVPYGKFLRSTSLDELPELLNILVGDMSIIGPRPLLVRYLSRYSEEQHHRHDVRPGLTGYAQVHGRNAISWEERFKLDLWYVHNISFLTDVKIILDTVKTVLSRKGITSGSAATMEEFMGTPTEEVHNK